MPCARFHFRSWSVRNRGESPTPVATTSIPPGGIASHTFPHDGVHVHQRGVRRDALLDVVPRVLLLEASRLVVSAPESAPPVAATRRAPV